MQTATLKRLAMIAGGIVFLVSAGEVGDYVVRGLDSLATHRARAAVPQSKVFSQFRDMAFAAGADLSRRPTYTAAYVEKRASQLCSLLYGNNFVGLTRELAFPPVVHMTESPKGRDLLEGLILRAAAQVQCPDQLAKYQQLRAPGSPR